MKVKSNKNRKPLISLKGITKTYVTGDVAYQALRGIDIDIGAGEFAAIMGPSGSGKSTTMHIIGALDTPSSGSYYLEGNNIADLDEDELALIRNRKIGFVFQSFNLLPRTSVLKNVERPLVYAGVRSGERRTRAMECLREVQLDDKRDNLSNQLSGGEIQRVAIARALVTNPAIILADEPTGNLDTTTAKQIMEYFKRLNGDGHTIIVITHEEEVAAYANRVIRLRDGLVVTDKRGA